MVLRASAARQDGNRQLAEQLAAVGARRNAGCERVAPVDGMIGFDGDLGIEAFGRPAIALTGEPREMTSDHDEKPLAAMQPHEGDDVVAIGACDLNRLVTAFAKQSRALVAKLDNLTDGESGTLLVEIRAATTAQGSIAGDLSKSLEGQLVLGLPVKLGVPEKPEGPTVACRIQIAGTEEKPEAQVQVAKSDGLAQAWVAVGKFTLTIDRADGKLKEAAFGDALAEEILSRLVRVQLSKGPLVKGKPTYKVRIDNASPLILNGLAIQGTVSKTDDLLKVLSGISISPFKNMTVPATSEMVDQLELRKGIRVIAADLSGL